MYEEYQNKSDSDDDSEQSSTPSFGEESPAHACSYCGIKRESSVVRCANKSCGKWFCNDKG